jgi:hypothetical protein
VERGVVAPEIPVAHLAGGDREHAAFGGADACPAGVVEGGDE